MKKLLHLWFLSAVAVGWVYLFTKICIEQDFKIQMYFVMFVLAPISEEILYRWLPVHLEKRNPNLGYAPGVLANFLFITIHTNNYPYAGVYWAFAFQGVMGFICLYACRKYGVWASILIHAKYNLAVNFLL